MAEKPALVRGFSEWAVTIEDKMQVLIPRVPEHLRSGKAHEKCFDPVLVSLGPYHYGKENLKPKEKYKLDAVKRYTNSINDYSNAEMYFEKFLGVAEKVREYYDIQEDFGDDFAKIMFMDSCFILDFIRGFEECSKGNVSITEATNVAVSADHNKGNDHQEVIISSTWSRRLDFNLVARDVMLLENQIPLLLLEELMLIKGRLSDTQSITSTSTSSDQGNNTNQQFTMKKIKEFVKKLLTLDGHGGKNNGSTSTNDTRTKYLHLLDLCRDMFLEGLTSTDDTRTKYKGGGHGKGKILSPTYQPARNYFRSVTELTETGIKFGCKGSSPRDIEFKSGLLAKLYLPHIIVDDMTKYLFSNMIAFELGLRSRSSSASASSNVISYVCFMDSLIDHEEDVKILRKKSILLNALGSDQEVATLFNELATDLSPEHDAYLEVKSQISDHYKSKWKYWLANLYYSQFRSPWTFIALISAIILFVLTAMQTFYSHRQVVYAAREWKQASSNSPPHA